jgi:hypothetical protein
MNRLIQLQSQVVSSSFDFHELNIALFGQFYEERLRSWKMIKENKVFHEHFHLDDLPLDELRLKSFLKMVCSTKHSGGKEDVKKLNFSTVNKVTAFCNGVTFNDLSFCILGGVHFFLYNRCLFQLGTEKHLTFFERAIDLQEMGCFALT